MTSVALENESRFSFFTFLLERPLFLSFGEITIFLFEQKSAPPTSGVSLKALVEGIQSQKYVG